MKFVMFVTINFTDPDFRDTNVTVVPELDTLTTNGRPAAMPYE